MFYSSQIQSTVINYYFFKNLLSLKLTYKFGKISKSRTMGKTGSFFTSHNATDVLKTLESSGSKIFFYMRKIYHWAIFHLMLFRTTIETVRLWPIWSKNKDFHNVNRNIKANQQNSVWQQRVSETRKHVDRQLLSAKMSTLSLLVLSDLNKQYFWPSLLTKNPCVPDWSVTSEFCQWLIIEEPRQTDYHIFL